MGKETIENLSLVIRDTSAYWEGESAESFRNAASDIARDMESSMSALLRLRSELRKRTGAEVSADERPVTNPLPTDLFD